MNVRLGWSGDIHGTWTKMDVEVDDSDLELHFADLGWEKGSYKISPIEKFKLMYSIAELFVQLHKMSKFPEYFNQEKDRKELADLIAARDNLTQKVVHRD